MDIGTGIAIAGVWVFAGLMGISDTVSGGGLVFAILIAATVTGLLY